MQDNANHQQPQPLAATVRLALAVAVGLALASVLAVATSASETAVRRMTAQMHDSTRYVTLPAVEIVGRRELAPGAVPGTSRSAAAASTSCVQPS